MPPRILLFHFTQRKLLSLTRKEESSSQLDPFSSPVPKGTRLC